MFVMEKLRVYQKALDFGDKILNLIGDQRLGLTRALADQALRASTSVAANIAEGNGRRSQAERRRFFVIARGSLMECLPLIHFLRTRSFLSQSAYLDLRADLAVLSKMLNALIGRDEN